MQILSREDQIKKMARIVDFANAVYDIFEIDYQDLNTEDLIIAIHLIRVELVDAIQDAVKEGAH